MTASRHQLVCDAAARGKYAPLYRHLLSAHPGREWRTTFGEVESILGFRLPGSARLHRPWWSNSKKGSGHSHALAWQAAGWRTREVDIEAETLVFAHGERRLLTSNVKDFRRYGERIELFALARGHAARLVMEDLAKEAKAE